jgi:hypothetical protein
MRRGVEYSRRARWNRWWRVTDEIVHIPIPSYPIRNPRHLLRKSLIMGFSLSIQPRSPSWYNKQDLVRPLLNSISIYRYGSNVSPLSDPSDQVSP